MNHEEEGHRCIRDCLLPCVQGTCYLRWHTLRIVLWVVGVLVVILAIAYYIMARYRRERGYVKAGGCGLCTKWVRAEPVAVTSVRPATAMVAEPVKNYTLTTQIVPPDV